MATFVTGIAEVFADGADNGTTASFSPSPSGSNTFIFGGMVASTIFSPPFPALSDLRFGGSGGTALTKIGTDESFLFGSGATAAFARAPGPSGSSDVYGDWGDTADKAGAGAVCYSGVDQTTPYAGIVQNSGTTDATTVRLSVAVTGGTSGQTCVAVFGAVNVSFDALPFTAVAGSTIRAQGTGGFAGIAFVEGVCDGSGNCTLEVDANQTAANAIAWSGIGCRLNDSTGGGSAIAAISNYYRMMGSA